MHDTRDFGLPAAISEQVRGLITRGALSPGVHLGQTGLAARFDTSRVPVREALKLLAAEGIVVHDPNRGFFVAELSSSEARQLYRLRHLVETELLTTIVWPSKAVIAQLNGIVDELERLLDVGDLPGWSSLHREFHRNVFDLSEQKVLVREVLRLWALTDRYRSLLPPPVASEERETGERLFVASLAAQDRAGLIRVFQDDRSNVEKMLLGILAARNL
jgi:DNA-binding GntR family transcriptional regulator